MPRPRTTGDPITFRLPLDQHQFVAARAEAKGVSINEYVRSAYSNSIAKTMNPIDDTVTASEHEPVTNPDRPGYRQIHR